MTQTLDKPVALNNYTNDTLTENGVRISLPIYIDVPNRKPLLNALRSLVEQEKFDYTPKSQSGIGVSTAVAGGSSIERYLGVSLETLRSSILFSRGGLDITLLLRIQSVTGIEVCPVADIEKALKTRIKQVKDFAANHAYTPPNSLM